MADDPTILWSFHPQTRHPLPGMPFLRLVACQEARTPAYHIVPRPPTQHGFAIFQYTLSGCGSFHDGNGDRRVPAGCGFLCHNEDPTVHYRYPPQARQPWRYVYATWFCQRETVNALLGNGPTFRFPTDHDLINSMLACQTVTDARVSAARSTELATRFIVGLARECQTPETTPTTSLHARLQRLCLDGGPIPDIGHLAQRLDWSREHLSRQYRREQGHTLSGQILRWRLERATDLLRSSADLDIASIANQSGFSDSGHLARHFRRLHSLTPSQYRALVRDGSDI